MVCVHKDVDPVRVSQGVDDRGFAIRLAGPVGILASINGLTSAPVA